MHIARTIEPPTCMIELPKCTACSTAHIARTTVHTGRTTDPMTGVISTQKVIFCVLFKIGFEYFLCTNHMN